MGNLLRVGITYPVQGRVIGLVTHGRLYEEFYRPFCSQIKLRLIG
jgi:hypothetical protein